MLCKWPHAVGYLIPPAVDPSHVTWPSFPPFFFLPLLCSSPSPALSASPTACERCSVLPFPLSFHYCFSPFPFLLYSSSSLFVRPLSLARWRRHHRFKGLISSLLTATRSTTLSPVSTYVLCDWERIGYIYTGSCRISEKDQWRRVWKNDLPLKRFAQVIDS